MKIFAIITFIVAMVSGSASAGEIRFFDEPGKWKIPGRGNFVQVKEAPQGLSFKIRDTESAEPDLQKDRNWFIAMEDKDHFWVYFGNGKLQYFVWQKEPDNSLQVTEKSYPKMGDLTLPPEVEERVKKDVAPAQ
jgi:hypothetical protein